MPSPTMVNGARSISKMTVERSYNQLNKTWFWRFSLFVIFICMLFHILVYAIQCFSVAGQDYRVTVHEESVILGNAALLKCNLPSFVADFLSVTAWVDSEGLTYHFGSGENLGNSRL